VSDIHNRLEDPHGSLYSSKKNVVIMAQKQRLKITAIKYIPIKLSMGIVSIQLIGADGKEFWAELDNPEIVEQMQMDCQDCLSCIGC
jgi:hypothetical protein